MTAGPGVRAEALAPIESLLPVGARVKFEGDRRWWEVRAASERFTVLTRQAEFEKSGVLRYSIIDRDREVRGPCNQIGQGYGDGTFSDAQCSALIDDLENGVWEVSWRNNVPVVITASDKRLAAPGRRAKPTEGEPI